MKSEKEEVCYKILYYLKNPQYDDEKWLEYLKISQSIGKFFFIWGEELCAIIYSCTVISHPYTNICLFGCIMHNPLFLYFWCCFIILLVLRQAAFLSYYFNKSPNWQYYSKPPYFFSINFYATEQPSWGNNGPIHTEFLLWLIPSSQLCHLTMYVIYSFQHHICIFYSLCSFPWYQTLSHQYL